MPVARSMVLLLGLAVAWCGGTSPWTVIAARAATSAEATPPRDDDTDAQPEGAIAPVALRPDSTGTRYVAPALEVRGRRLTPQSRLDRGAGFATVLDASAWAGEARSAADVLGRAVGVNVRDSGGVGGYSTLSVRGSTSSQVPVYLDGVLLNGADTGEVDLADVALEQLDRIEVYRGSAPLTLGGASLGGAVHLFSAAGAHPWRAMLAHGSHGTLNGEVAGTQSLDGWQLNLRARAVRSEGDWSFLDDRGTLYNPDDDAVRARANNDVRGGGVLIGAARDWGDGRLQLSEMIDARERGLPGYSVVQSATARSQSLTHQFRLGWTSARANGHVLRSVEVHHRTEVQGVRDLDADLGRSPRDRTDRLHLLGLSVGGALSRFGERAWRAEFDASRLRSRDRARLDGEGEPQSRLSAALAFEPHLRVLHERLLIAPGLRVERHFERWHRSASSGALPAGDAQRAARTLRTAQIGARYALSDELSVKANLGSFERIPTLFELFGDRGTAQGNPDLRAESGTNRDVGIVWNRSREGRRFAASYFWNDAFDLITFVRTSTATAKAFNVGRAEIEGLELEADFGRFGPFGLVASVTRLSTRDLTDSAVAGGKQLPGRPGYEFELEHSVQVGRLDASWSLFALGDNYAQTGERAPVPSRVLLGLDARWRLRDDLSLLGRVDNLGDVEAFDLWGHPLPGRWVTIALQAEVSRAR